MKRTHFALEGSARVQIMVSVKFKGDYLFGSMKKYPANSFDSTLSRQCDIKCGLLTIWQKVCLNGKKVEELLKQKVFILQETKEKMSLLVLDFSDQTSQPSVCILYPTSSQ